MKQYFKHFCTTTMKSNANTQKKFYFCKSPNMHCRLIKEKNRTSTCSQSHILTHRPFISLCHIQSLAGREVFRWSLWYLSLLAQLFALWFLCFALSSEYCFWPLILPHILDQFVFPSLKLLHLYSLRLASPTDFRQIRLGYLSFAMQTSV